MIVNDVVEEIRFATSTVHDLSGRNVNELFSTKDIIRQLKFALDEYAQYTRAIEGILSVPYDTNNRVIAAPPDVLRSMGYRFIYTWIGGRKYPVDMANFNVTQSEFPYDTYVGIPRWILPFEEDLYVYPLNSTGFSKANLSNKVFKEDTSISVDSTAGFQERNGRITIGAEKIKYQRKTDTEFLECSRGVENTTAADHENSALVNENNVFIFYYKKHFVIEIIDDGKKSTIKKAFLNREMEVDDAHILTIINRTAYLLLKKVDPQRASSFKVDWETWLKTAKNDILAGRSDINPSGSIRSMYDWENPQAFDVY